jgi:mono/diheme cytochrome c family protein
MRRFFSLVSGIKRRWHWLALWSGISLCALNGWSAEVSTNIVKIEVKPINPAEAAKVSYVRDIQPLFDSRCSDCHSGDDLKGDFSTESVANLIKGGKKSHPAIIPGKPDESPLVQYLLGQKTPQMPKTNKKFNADELLLVRSWIAAGAVDDTGKVQLAAKTAAPKPNSLLAINSKDPAVQEALKTLLFSSDNEQRMIAERTIRMGLLPPAPVTPKVTGPVLNPIDQFIEAKWEQAKLPEAKTPPPVCDDEIFARRAYLDVIGLIPTVAETQRFLADPAPDKRGKLVDELLARNNDYAANWTPFWEDALGSANVNVLGGIPTHGNLRQWIYTSFAANKPYDVMVAELIDPTLPGYQKPIVSEPNGARTVTGYVQHETHTMCIQTAANVGQVFLGTEMKCASCHNHFLNSEWPQARFLAFGGMFSTNDLESIRCEKHSGKYIAAKFPFDLPDAPTDVPTNYDARLHRLAQLLVDPNNPRFAKTIVNRLWKRYIGIGLFAPVDDFRLDQPPSHPELLDWLADDFIRHGYDLKHTIALILKSRTYELRYNAALEDHFDAAKPTLARYFRSPSLRKLTAEELIDSIRLASAQKLNPKDRSYLEIASTTLSRALGKPSSRSEVSTGRSQDVAVVAALELLNGEEYYKLIYSGAVAKEAAADKDETKAADQLYWSALDRPPTESEKTATTQLLALDGETGAGDVLWALFTCPEFQFIQ